MCADVRGYPRIWAPERGLVPNESMRLIEKQIDADADELEREIDAAAKESAG